MAKLKLSKSALGRETQNLKAYRRFLPALDLKRQQLTAERMRVRSELADTRAEIEQLRRCVAEELPMLANQGIALDSLVRVSNIELGEQNVVGTRLPILEQVRIAVPEYPLLGRPHWVDHLVIQLRAMLELRLREQIEQRRLELLDRAVRVVTQRVNLFDKVLIPRARKNIKRIQIYLSDNERAAIVNSKIAKRKQREVSLID